MLIYKKSGSPFNPITYKGVTYVIGQATNALPYPGLGLGAILVGAKHITDGMLAATARAVANLADVQFSRVFTPTTSRRFAKHF